MTECAICSLCYSKS